MNHARLLTDQAIALLEDAVIHVLKNARESGYAYIPADAYKPDPDGGHAYIRATYIGQEMGTYERTGTVGRIHRKILDKLENDHRVESLRSESGNQRIGWRLTDPEWKRLTLPE